MGVMDIVFYFRFYGSIFFPCCICLNDNDEPRALETNYVSLISLILLFVPNYNGLKMYHIKLIFNILEIA